VPKTKIISGAAARREVTASASLSSFVVDEDDDERGTVERGMDSERLDALLDKAATAPVSVQDIEEFYPYRLDEFQVAATELLVHGSSVVVSAPTGSGKTLVGETAILTALARGEKAIYTTPLKALSNQKLREFQKIFGKRRCGLKTGDVDINGDADVMIMTTEILRNMLYSSAAGGRDDERLADVSIIVLDDDTKDNIGQNQVLVRRGCNHTRRIKPEIKVLNPRGRTDRIASS